MCAKFQLCQSSSFWATFERYFRRYMSFWSEFNILSGIQGLNFWVEWQDSYPKFRNPVEKNCEGRKLPSRKILRLLCNTGQFLLVSIVVSYCRSEVMFFQFYQKLNVVPSKNSEISRAISCILLFFCEIIVYLSKMMMDLKNINCGEKFTFLQSVAKIVNFTYIMQNSSIFLTKKKLKQSVTRNDEFYRFLRKW